MNRIEKKFRELRKTGQKAFIVYITAGDPNLKTTGRLAETLVKNGVDIIEFGIPFSDPLADGPTIQAASERALKNRVNIKSILNLTKSLRTKIDEPFVFMTYYNPVLQYGLERFVRDAKKSGVDGVIIPDLPVEESKDLIKVAERIDFDCIFLASPTSTDKKLKIIAQKSRGFIYYISLTGVTGARNELSKDILSNVRKIKKYTDKPVCVGFGVSTPLQAKHIARFADGVIVGSAVVKIVEKHIGRKDLLSKVGEFTVSLAKGIKS